MKNSGECSTLRVLFFVRELYLQGRMGIMVKKPKKVYRAPEVDFVLFSVKDVLMVSGENQDQNQGEWDVNRKKKEEW